MQLSVTSVQKDFSGEFHLTVFRNPHATILLRDAINETINDTINETINSFNCIINRKLIPLLQKSLPTIERAVAKLKKQGLIEYRGSKKTGGYYPLFPPSGETPS